MTILGMYEDNYFPQVQIGKYIIRRQDDKNVWIENTDSGEGGAFPDRSFEIAIDAYWNTNL